MLSWITYSHLFRRWCGNQIKDFLTKSKGENPRGKTPKQQQRNNNNSSLVKQFISSSDTMWNSPRIYKGAGRPRLRLLKRDQVSRRPKSITGLQVRRSLSGGRQGEDGLKESDFWGLTVHPLPRLPCSIVTLGEKAWPVEDARSAERERENCKSKKVRREEGAYNLKVVWATLLPPYPLYTGGLCQESYLGNAASQGRRREEDIVTAASPPCPSLGSNVRWSARQSQGFTAASLGQHDHHCAFTSTGN